MEEENDLAKIEAELGFLEFEGLSSYSSFHSKEHLVKLEKEKIKILQRIEETWRLKSKATSLKGGDENTKLFQQFSRGRKNVNTIWSHRDKNVREANSFAQIAEFAVCHFLEIYKRPREANIVEILRVQESIPIFVEEEDKEILNAPISLVELKATLKGMGKDKSPSPDGWPIEFFTAFFISSVKTFYLLQKTIAL